MLKKRIIPCLDIKDGRTVKGVNFINLRDAGDPIALAKYYSQQGADELVFLDITASHENRKTLLHLVTQIAQNINIPFAVGGGITSVEDAQRVIQAGADKVSINSAAVKNPKLIKEIADVLGSQSVIVAIDIKQVENQWTVYINGGRVATHKEAVHWAREAEQLGAGEILLTSMNHDGSKSGFAYDITNLIAQAVNIPVIASGGAGTYQHFSKLFTNSKISAALAAGIFHDNEIQLTELKNYLQQNNIPIR